ncbi:PriCT-2 domain-containing protein [Salinarimonas soli]|uniref:DNA primase/polymerase bifunctional N-terminal domain-containing protein n=1 Tax=Salinarimonas soli TaxID=1638099 RepID=A0A5B2VEQ5_9HYPH|nr:PriCT-2 domain-containing protein [Salinarimonas soli]KAA2237078.1 hypothetical protein F0L46_11480 [Salinarimonas soli]
MNARADSAAELTALRLRLRENGYCPVPVSGPHVNVKAAGKRPLMSNWQQRCLGADQGVIERWSRSYAMCTNTGLLCGELVGIDIDVLDPDLASNLTRRALTHLGSTPLLRIGRAPKTLLCYRVKLPVEKVQTPEFRFGENRARVEILATGQQFVAFGVHPETHAPYQWTEASPVDVPFDELPIVDHGLLRTFVNDAAAILRLAGGMTATDVRTRGREQQRHERAGRRAAGMRLGTPPDPATVADALDHLPNNFDYDGWVRIGFALYDALGEAGRDLWERWSARSHRNDTDLTAAKWSTFAAGRQVTVGTLFWHAAEHGWRRPSARERASQAISNAASATEQHRRTIRLGGGDLPAVVAAAEQALIDSEIGIYQRGNLIVRPAAAPVIIADGRSVPAMRLVSVRTPHMADLMTRVARWERFDLRSKEWAPIDCPQRVAETYLAREGEWRVPVLAGIVNCPVLRRDGSLLQTPGYDSATGLLFEPQGVTFSPIPEQPDRAAAVDGLAELRALLASFPFVTDADRSVALSAILTAITRRSLPTAPMHAFSAPAAGSGKSLLVDIASAIMDGRRAAVMAAGKTEEEAEKRLGAALLAGDAIISIDNVERPLGGELFCQSLTQPSLKVRVLGMSRLADVPCNAAMFATGNNLVLLGDMTRRTLLCSLDAGVERPETRAFETDPVEMVLADRGRYVEAALTILRAFHLAGRPQQTAPLGSFVDWSRWVRGALIWLGEADPCESMDKVRSADPRLESLTAVVTQWEEVIGSERVSVKHVIDRAIELEEASLGDGLYAARKPRPYKHPEFREALLAVAGEGGAISSRRLGRWLASNQNRLVGCYKIVADGIVEGITRWRLHRA